MATRRRRRHTRKKRQKGRKQKGGVAPFMVDFKRGFQVTKDMIKAVKTPIDVKKAKAEVRGYKREYQDYKRRGGNKSFNSWVIDKGYGTRNAGCCIM